MDKNRLLVQQMLSEQFGMPLHTDPVDFVNHLAIEINALILHDFPKLVNILYRIDIDESKLKETLAHYIHDDAGYIIAQLVIERQLEKLKTRESFK